MIIQLFVFALLFIGFGIFAFFKKKNIIGFTFFLLGILLTTVGIVVVYLYPHTLPF